MVGLLDAPLLLEIGLTFVLICPLYLESGVFPELLLLVLLVVALVLGKIGTFGPFKSFGLLFICLEFAVAIWLQLALAILALESGFCVNCFLIVLF